jgi:hypothetical protein
VASALDRQALQRLTYRCQKSRGYPLTRRKKSLKVDGMQTCYRITIVVWHGDGKLPLESTTTTRML